MMNSEILVVLHRIPSESKSVYLYLLGLINVHSKVGLTQQEISRATRLSVGAVREALGWLESPSYRDAGLTTQDEISPFISVVKYSNRHKIKLLVPYVPEEHVIQFTFEDTDSRRIAVLEKEVTRLASRKGQTSKLSLYIKGERQQVVAEVEQDLGRALTVEESFLLGGILHLFGIERVKKAWRTKAHDMTRPVVGIYAMLINGTSGKAYKPSDKVPETKYAPIIRESY